MIKHLKEEKFEDLVKDGFWIVDFYAEWCSPCKMLSPILENIDENILKVNVDEHEKLATEFGVMSIPTLVFLKNGVIKEKTIGLKSKDEILKIIAKIKG